MKKEIPERLIIKKPLIEPYSIVIVAVLISFLIYMSSNISGLVLAGVLISIGFLAYKIFDGYKDRKPKIIIDKRGIEICSKNTLYEWSKIKYAYVKSKVEGSGQNTNSIDYLHVITKWGEISEKINDYQYSFRLVKETIEYYSRRDIGDLSDKIRDEIREITGGESDMVEIMNILSTYKTRISVFGLLLFFILFGSGIYGQFVFSFPYIFATGFALTFIIIYAMVKISEKRLRRNRVFSGLSDDEFEQILIKRNIKQKANSNDMKIAIIFMSIFIIGVFVISYIASSQ